MENNFLVPIKTKIAALMLIGAGLASAIVFLFSFFERFRHIATANSGFTPEFFWNNPLIFRPEMRN
jgi:hypothetical protein